MNDRYSRQRGFGLIEIMISLVVGLILTAGVIQIFTANKQTYRMLDAGGGIQENLRFGMEMLGRYLRIAGYRNDPTISMDSAFPAVPAGTPVNPPGASVDLEFAIAGQVVSGSDNDIVFRYLGDGSTRTCTGSLPNSGEMVNMRLFLNGTDLQCRAEVLDLTTSPITEQNDQTQPLVGDITNLLFRYGVDTDGDGTANRYDRAAGVTDWSQVVSVRMTLTLQSAEANTSTTMGSRLQRGYTTTIGLRNRLP